MLYNIMNSYSETLLLLQFMRLCNHIPFQGTLGWQVNVLAIAIQDLGNHCWTNVPRCANLSPISLFWLMKFGSWIKTVDKLIPLAPKKVKCQLFFPKKNRLCNLFLQFINIKGSVSTNVTIEINTMVPQLIRFVRSHDFFYRLLRFHDWSFPSTESCYGESGLTCLKWLLLSFWRFTSFSDIIYQNGKWNSIPSSQQL